MASMIERAQILGATRACKHIFRKGAHVGAELIYATVMSRDEPDFMESTSETFNDAGSAWSRYENVWTSFNTFPLLLNMIISFWLDWQGIQWQVMAIVNALANLAKAETNRRKVLEEGQCLREERRYLKHKVKDLEDYQDHTQGLEWDVKRIKGERTSLRDKADWVKDELKW